MCSVHNVLLVYLSHCNYTWSWSSALDIIIEAGKRVMTERLQNQAWRFHCPCGLPIYEPLRLTPTDHTGREMVTSYHPLFITLFPRPRYNSARWFWTLWCTCSYSFYKYSSATQIFYSLLDQLVTYLVFNWRYISI